VTAERAFESNARLILPCPEPSSQGTIPHVPPAGKGQGRLHESVPAHTNPSNSRSGESDSLSESVPDQAIPSQSPLKRIRVNPRSVESESIPAQATSIPIPRSRV
jgi:hypothetical protein